MTTTTPAVPGAVPGGAPGAATGSGSAAPVLRASGTGARAARAGVLALAVVYFAGPLLAALWFTVSSRSAPFSLAAYGRVWGAPGLADALGLSLVIAGLTVLLTLVLLVPTALVVHLRLPRLRAAVDVLCLLPLVVPVIVLVVGVRGVLGWGPDQLAGTPFEELLSGVQSGWLPWVLPLEYVVLALPFTYRALDAGLRTSAAATLVEASLSLGASWPVTIWRVVLPTLRTALLNAAFLSFALVLGEFTMASILQYQTFSVWILQFDNTDGQLSVAISLLSLLLTWGLLLLIAVVSRGRTRAPRRDRKA